MSSDTDHIPLKLGVRGETKTSAAATVGALPPWLAGAYAERNTPQGEEVCSSVSFVALNIIIQQRRLRHTFLQSINELG